MAQLVLCTMSSALTHTHMHTRTLAFLWTCIFRPSNLVSSSVDVLHRTEAGGKSAHPQ